MEIKNVTVAGGGVLGSQIALQSAYCGFNVKIWLRSEGSIGRCAPVITTGFALCCTRYDRAAAEYAIVSVP